MINFKVPKMIQVYKVSKGNIWYVCSCGRLASVRVHDYSKKVRCKQCTAMNALLTSRLKYTELTPLDYLEIFDKFYLNGLLDYVEDHVGK